MNFMDNSLPDEVVIGRINKILTTSAEQCCPKPKAPGKPKLYKWCPLMKPLVAEVKQLFWQWKQQSKPTDLSHPIVMQLTAAKKELHKMQSQTAAAAERDARHSAIMNA